MNSNKLSSNDSWRFKIKTPWVIKQFLKKKKNDDGSWKCSKGGLGLALLYSSNPTSQENKVELCPDWEGQDTGIRGTLKNNISDICV